MRVPSPSRSRRNARNRTHPPRDRDEHRAARKRRARLPRAARCSPAHCPIGHCARARLLDENRKELEGNWDLACTHKLPEPCRAEINELMKVSDVEPLKGRRLLVTFSDGAVQEVDVAGLLEVGGMFAPITTAGLSSSSTREPGHADSRMARGIQPRQKKPSNPACFS